MATDADAVDDQKRTSTVKTLAKYMEDSLGLQKSMAAGRTGFERYFNWKWGRNTNAYLSGLYIFIKMLYMANVIGQFFLLNQFLGTNYSFWGIQILSDLANGREWKDSGAQFCLTFNSLCSSLISCRPFSTSYIVRFHSSRTWKYPSSYYSMYAYYSIIYYLI